MKRRESTAPKLITTILIGAIALATVYRQKTTSAADSETITYGATDPTWSPEGKRLAFSLYGSIWSVAADGGEAEQITTSPGYHAHPAWSPGGDTIAYVRGAAPAALMPNVTGAVMTVDVTTGQEREISTPLPAAGTLTWSPDGRRLACALRSTLSNAMLHEIDLAANQVVNLQAANSPATGVPWVNAAWNPKRAEIFVTGERGGAPQIWSMAPSGPTVMIQMPLTRYRKEDIVQLHSIAALPDGSGLIYSAVAVNGKGDYELYRIPREGGKPVDITNSTRDEFAPAVSPDGRRVAFVSNQMGNMDLFTMPLGGGDRKHVRLTGLKFRQASGRVHLRILDEIGAPSPARIFVQASDGKAYCPSGSPIYYYPLTPDSTRRDGFFLSTGDDTFPAPAGKLQLTALKGVEYSLSDQSVDVPPGQTAEVTMTMRRWTNWAQRGWYTGENHYHANYNGTYYQRPIESMRWLQAEDLNAANMIVANSEGAFIHDKEFFRGAPDPLSTERYVLYWGQEYRNSFPLGHMAFLNIKKQVPPSFTSVIGSNSSYDYPLNTMAALEARKQGGLVSYVHPMNQGLRDVFDTRLGAKELPVGAALGAVDSIDILPFGDAAYELWYRLLNCGFHISAGAGTDTFANWRSINRIPGSSRQYVDVGSAMSWDRWVSRFREGRNFVTSGPLLTFQINGEAPGAVIKVPSGSPYTARISGEVTSQFPLRQAELLRNGEVLERYQIPDNTRSWRFQKEVSVSGSAWFAYRVTGQSSRGVPDVNGVPRAHSGAIFVESGGRPVLLRGDLELMIRWVDRLWALLEERQNMGSAANRQKAREMILQARKHYQAKLTAAE